MKTKFLLLFCLFLTASLAAQPKLSENNIPEVVKAMSAREKALLVVGFNNGCEGYTPGLPGTGGLTHPFPQYGIPSVVMMDGPVGVRPGTGPFHDQFPHGPSDSGLLGQECGRKGW